MGDKYITFKRINNYGRLANNLWSLASMIGISLKLDRKVAIPTDWIHRDKFQIPDKFYKDVKTDKIIDEKVFHYNMSVFDEGREYNCIDIAGTFQSQKYFIHIKDDIKKWLMPKGVKNFDKWAVAMHLRCGDFFTCGQYVNYKPEYYLSAIDKYFNDERYKFYICTDDIEYAKIHFKGDRFIIKEREPIEDLKILIGCRHKILCNSTFSWWGAYLSTNKGKVIHPLKIFAGKLAQIFTEIDFWPEDEGWICYDKPYKIDLSDVTFIIPTAYDHKDRKENLDLTISMLLQAFDTNIIIGEQGSHPRFSYTEKHGRYIYFDNMKEFHRTKMLNRMTELADTPIVVNWDADVIFPPQQVLNMVKMLRGDYDFVYPYSGAFLRVGNGAYGRNQEYIQSIQESKNIGFLKGIEFLGKDDKSVGGAIGYKKHAFIEVGMENENFIAYAPEDVERYHRFNILNYTVGRIAGPLYHLNHHCGEVSLPSNPHFRAGHHELKKVKGMTKENLLKYIQTWEWVDKRKIAFVTYADENFADRQAKLAVRATISGQMDKVITYGREWLTGTEFYLNNKLILDKKQGGGFCLWKPYVILQALKDLEEDDIVFYLDSADIFTGDVRAFLLNKMKDVDILLTNGAFPNKEWTRRDCFIKMGCDKKVYWDTIQLEAGILAIKKTAFSIRILEEWLYWCSDYIAIVPDKKSTLGKDFPEFKEGRYDQSILTNLKVKYDLYSSSEMREFVTCNVSNIENPLIFDGEILDLKDVTFVMPVKCDHQDRRENIETVIGYLQSHFNTNIIVEEQGGEHFQYLEQQVTYLHSELPIFFRTRIINHLVKQASTPIVFVWDTDVIAPLEQIFDSVIQLRGTDDFAYPYGGGFVHVPREEIDDVMGFVDNGETIELSQFNIHSNSVGGAYGFKVESFLKAGMENEHFVRFGWEDVERISRFKKLGYKVYRSLGVLFHLDHFKGKDSNINNPDYIINRYEFNKVDKMTKPQLENYISSWEWLQKT